MTDKPNIHQRMHAVMQAVDYIQKDKKQGMNYTIVSHDAVTAKVRPKLVEHGIIYMPVAMTRTQDGNRTEIDLTLRFVNIDDTDDYIDVVSCGYGIDSQDKGPGKAISYAVKYALLKALGLETGDDPDYDDVPHERGAKSQPKTAPKQETKAARQDGDAAIKAWWKKAEETGSCALKVPEKDGGSDWHVWHGRMTKLLEGAPDFDAVGRLVRDNQPAIVNLEKALPKAWQTLNTAIADAEARLNPMMGG